MRASNNPARPTADAVSAVRGKSQGITLLDVAAFVAGAAVSSVHLRDHADGELARDAPGLFWLTFAGIAVTAAGPFLWLTKRFLRPVAGYPTKSDRSWIALGFAWAATAPICLFATGSTSEGPGFPPQVLAVAIGIACVYVLGLHWTSWRRGGEISENEPSWTARVGAIVAVTWPLQCGFALIRLST